MTVQQLTALKDELAAVRQAHYQDASLADAKVVIAERDLTLAKCTHAEAQGRFYGLDSAVKRLELEILKRTGEELAAKEARKKPATPAAT